MAWLTELIFFVVRHRANYSFHEPFCGVRGEVDGACRHDGAWPLSRVQRCSRPQRPETLRREAGNEPEGENYCQKQSMGSESHHYASFLGKAQVKALTS